MHTGRRRAVRRVMGKIDGMVVELEARLSTEGIISRTRAQRMAQIIRDVLCISWRHFEVQNTGTIATSCEGNVRLPHSTAFEA